MDEKKRTYLERAVADAFENVREALNGKGYQFYPYIASGNEEAVSIMMAMKSAAQFHILELTEEEVEGKLEAASDFETIYRECGGIYLRGEGGGYYPEFVILKESDADSKYDLTLGGFFPEKAPPAAIEATAILVVEVADLEILPEVEQAVVLWNQNLKALADRGLIEPREARVVQIA